MAQWKEVEGYEELYLVSDKGEILALPKITRSGNKLLHRRAKPLKKWLRGKNGFKYEAVTLHKDGKKQMVSVHRLVANAFLPNPDGLSEINHKDRNPLNNEVSNLEWCSRQYNIDYSKSKPVEQVLDGAVINRFQSISNASKETGIRRTAINNVLTGWSKSAGGYQWRYRQK